MENLTEALVARFKNNPNVEFSLAETETLAAASGQNIWAAKAAALYFFKARDVPRALELTIQIAKREPTDENICNVAVAYRDTAQFAACIAWLESNEQFVDKVRYHDLLCSNFAYLGDRDSAILHGDASLALKDARAGASPIGHTYKLNAFDHTDRQRNVIAFSIWGANERYLRGAINNAIVARYLYPGWVARFYTNNSTPLEFRAALQQNAAEVVMMPDEAAADYGLYWRFLVEDDERVDFYLVRDADSVMNVKERSAVANWLKSGRAFHVMRDDLQHSELILAGMWGAHRGNIGDMRGRIARFIQTLPKIGNYLHKDQHFLRQVVWPIMRDSVQIHDRHFNFMNPARYDPDYELPARIHIGQNDWVHYRRT